jgi:hypothetical protein
MIRKYIRNLLVPVAVMVFIPETGGRAGGYDANKVYEARPAPSSYCTA